MILQIFRAIKSNYKTQGFGENLACAKVDNDRPVMINGNYVIVGKSTNVCPVGYSEFYPLIGMKGHNGEDWRTWHGEPIYFPVRAKNKKGEWIKWFAKSEVDYAGGIGVDVFSDERVYFPECPKEMGHLKMIEQEWNENQGWLFVKFRFWHLKETHIKDTFEPGGDYQWIKTGDFLGKCDNTGASSGDHTHNGMKITNDQKTWTIDNDNGYYGGIDLPEGSFSNKFILDVLIEEKKLEVDEKKKELEAKIIQAQLSLIDLLRQLLSELQIQVLKLSTKVGAIISNK